MTDHDNLHTALAAVQADLPQIGKAHTAKTKSFTYQYASLRDVNDALLPLLSEHGLTWACLPDADGRVVGLLTHAPSGESLESSWPLPKTTDPQALGSALTYSRRYLLTAVVGSAPDEDDDGAAAQRAPRGNGCDYCDGFGTVDDPNTSQSAPCVDCDEGRQQAVDDLRRRIGKLGEGIFGPLSDWLTQHEAEKVADLDGDGLVALDIQLDAWEGDADG